MANNLQQSTGRGQKGLRFLSLPLKQEATYAPEVSCFGIQKRENMAKTYSCINYSIQGASPRKMRSWKLSKGAQGTQLKRSLFRALWVYGCLKQGYTRMGVGRRGHWLSEGQGQERAASGLKGIWFNFSIHKWKVWPSKKEYPFLGHPLTSSHKKKCTQGKWEWGTWWYSVLVHEP